MVVSATLFAFPAAGQVELHYLKLWMVNNKDIKMYKEV